MNTPKTTEQRIQGVLKSLEITMFKHEKLSTYFDSLDKVELIMELEKEFSISVLDAEMHDIVTLEDVIKLIDGKVNK